jgi:arylformamidase
MEEQDRLTRWAGMIGALGARVEATFLEAEYNNRTRVPEHPLLIDAWNRDAAAFRNEAVGEFDLPYGTTARTQLDLFLPDAEPAAIAMFIHGGYWQAFDKDSFSHLARGLVLRQIGVAIPSYDLCPAVGIAAIVEQMREACLYLAHRCQRPLTVFGHSAGGHLAACMLATDWRARTQPNPVTAAYAISGLFDLEPLIHTSINTKLCLSLEEARNLSPIRWPAPIGRSLIAAVGTLESSEYLRQSRSLCATWGGHGTNTRLNEVDGANHFTIIAPLADPDSVMTNAISALAQGAMPAK